MTAGERKVVLTVEEAREALGISRGLAYRAVQAGIIPTLRIGRRILVQRAALIASIQMDRGEAQVEGRQRVAEELTATLQEVPGIKPVYVAPGCTHSFYRI